MTGSAAVGPVGDLARAAAGTGAVGEYAGIDETIAPAALDTISTWIRAHTAKR